MNLNRLALAVGALLVVGSIAVGMLPDSADQSGEVGTSLVMYGGAVQAPPASLARLVESSSAIVVARYVSSTSGTTVTLATPSSTGEPPAESPVVNTEVEIDEVLKGSLEIDDNIVYSIFGRIPVSSTDLSVDAAAGFPHLWPIDTEFVLFLTKEDPGFDWYYINDGACGRVLTGEPTVSCSDGDRTVSSYMTGLSREAFIDAVVDEIENPSPTNTPFPSATSEPTETPCSGPGC